MSPETLKVTLSKIFFPVRFNKLMNIAALFFSRPASVEPAQHLNMISVLFSNGNNAVPGPSHTIKEDVTATYATYVSRRLSLNIIDIVVQLRGSGLGRLQSEPSETTLSPPNVTFLF
jgi:hypothetical protein